MELLTQEINPNHFPIFDNHAHYDDAAFADDLPALVAEMKQNGLTGVINCGVNYESSRACISLAEQYDGFFAAVGVHPEDLYGDEPLDTAQLQKLAAHKAVVAIGEIGLDYHWDTFSPELQKRWFSEQTELAKALALPIIVHDRDAHNDTLALLKQHKPQGVVHCFSGSAETAKELLRLGLYIGVGGVATFKNARKTVEVVQMLPLDRLLLETDAPYLSPEPFRGKRCRSDYIYFTASRIAEIKGISPAEVLSASNQNSLQLFTRLRNC